MKIFQDPFLQRLMFAATLYIVTMAAWAHE